MKNKIEKSFYNWCKENNKDNILELWDYDYNKCTPHDIYYKSGAICHFYCKNNKLHKGRYISLNSITFGNMSEFRCQECNSFYNWCIENKKEHILDMWDSKLNLISPKDVSKNSNEKFWFKVNYKNKMVSQQFILSYIVKKNITPFYHQTFYQWCIDNNRNDIINRWDYDLNDIDLKEISCGTKTKYWFKCPRGIHKSELKSIDNFTKGNEGTMKCKQCHSFAQWGIDNIGDDFLIKYWDYNLNKVNPFEISSANDTKIWIKCQEKDYHGSYEIKCYSFKDGRRCSKCNPRKNTIINKYDSLGYLFPEIMSIWSDKNDSSPYDYLPNSISQVWWKCADRIHEDYYRKINVSNMHNFRCPECSKERTESTLQEKVRLFIENNYDFTINHERNCILSPINPKTNYHLLYDNEIVELKLIIEVHGQQHYNINGLAYLIHNNSSDINNLFKYYKWKDQFKKEYALQNGYSYLEIPYWAINNNTYETLIKNKITRILESQKALFCC